MKNMRELKGIKIRKKGEIHPTVRKSHSKETDQRLKKINKQEKTDILAAGIILENFLKRIENEKK